MSAPDLAALVWATVIMFALLSAGAVVVWVRDLLAEIRALREAQEAAHPDVFGRLAAERPEVARRWTA